MKTELEKTLRNIEQIRNSKGYTQDYVASKIGMKQAGYALIMKGERGLQFEMLEQIAILFEMDITDIIKYPDKYEKVGTQQKITKVLVELDVSEDEFIKLGLKDKVLQILNK
ncbi:hypothetical protein FACS1894145_5730 [Bacteroidia bacterium]|nr:hypothetical protein FACS1894145_5730 [Bacteroidia bacterium]